MSQVYMPQQRPGAIQQSLGVLQAGNAAMGMKNSLSGGGQTPTTDPTQPDPTAQGSAGNVGSTPGMGLTDQSQQSGMQGAMGRRANRLGQGPSQGGY